MNKTKTDKRHLFLKIALTVLAAVLLLGAGALGMCLLNNRPAVQTVAAYQNSNTDITIQTDGDNGIEILPQNHPAPETGIIFYVGAQIEPEAYIPLLSLIAKQGYACFIPKLTCNMAALEPKAAESIIKDHPLIKAWYLAGHSMGGLTASGFAFDHPNEVKGLILLAAYTNRDFSLTDLPTLSVFGDTDGVLNLSLYEERKAWYSKDFEEHILNGANHAQFGDYGEQPRDEKAAVSQKQQQSETADIILNWLNRHETNQAKNKIGEEH